MSKRRIVVMVSGLIIVIGLIIGLCQLLAPGKKEITEEDYKENPKYLLEEVIVSEDGKHFELPKVKKVWSYRYNYHYDFNGQECNACGVVEISEKNYNSIIEQLDNDLNIKREEESEYKDKKLVALGGCAVEEVDIEGTPISELEKTQVVHPHKDANITYMFKSKDCKYQTKRQGEMLMVVMMIEKYDKYYMAFYRDLDFRMFEPKIGEQEETQTGEGAEKETEKETERVAKIIELGNQNIEQLEKVTDAFCDVQLNQNGNVFEWKSDKATATADVYGGIMDVPNCRISYSSSRGVVNNMEIFVGDPYNTKFYETDITGDGYDDLVVTSWIATGTGCLTQGVYVYDFKNKKVLYPVAQYGEDYKEEQKQDILKQYKIWYDSGTSEVFWANNRNLDKLATSADRFMVSVVMYDGKPALCVKTSVDARGDRVYGNSLTTVLVYDGKEFKVKDMTIKLIENTNVVF